MQDKGKHIEGKFQHNLVCKQKPQDTFSMTKHALICSYHKDVKEIKNCYRNTRRDVFLGNESIFQHTAKV